MSRILTAGLAHDNRASRRRRGAKYYMDRLLVFCHDQNLRAGIPGAGRVPGALALAQKKQTEGETDCENHDI